MSTLYISEYVNLAAANAGAQIGQEPAIAEQAIAIGAGSTQSVAFQSGTRFVRLHCDAICSVKFGLDPVATAVIKRMVAGQTEYFGVKGGGKLAVIANT